MDAKKIRNCLLLFILVFASVCVSPAKEAAAQSKTIQTETWGNPTKKNKTSKKKRTYKKKLKKKSKKTKTTKKVKKTSSTKNKIVNGKKVKTVTQKTITTTMKYKKNSKIVNVTESTVTKTTTYTYKRVVYTKTVNVNTSTSSQYPPGVYDVAALAPKANSNVINAFKSLGFLVKIDPTCTTAGVFQMSSRTITLNHYSDNIYHELGHFLFDITGFYNTAEAQSIYLAEKDKVTSFNKSYIISSQGEYLAESYRSYLLDNASLRTSRPRTYAYVEQALAKLTDNFVAVVKQTYSTIWD